MKQLTLAFALALSVLATSPVIAQADESVETDITIRVGGDKSSTVSESKSTEDFVEFMRGMLGDTVADEIASEFAELDDDERAKLEKKLAKEDFKSITFDSDDFGNAIIIPILAITLSLGMPIIIVLLVLYFGYRKRRQRAELIRSFIDAGKDVPQQLLDDQPGANPLRSGLTLVAVAAAISIAFFIIGETEISALALIPLFLGLARLAFYYSDTNKNKSGD